MWTEQINPEVEAHQHTFSIWMQQINPKIRCNNFKPKPLSSINQPTMGRQPTRDHSINIFNQMLSPPSTLAFPDMASTVLVMVSSPSHPCCQGPNPPCHLYLIQEWGMYKGFRGWDQDRVNYPKTQDRASYPKPTPLTSLIIRLTPHLISTWP